MKLVELLLQQFRVIRDHLNSKGLASNKLFLTFEWGRLFNHANSQLKIRQIRIHNTRTFDVN